MKARRSWSVAGCVLSLRMLKLMFAEFFSCCRSGNTARILLRSASELHTSVNLFLSSLWLLRPSAVPRLIVFLAHDVVNLNTVMMSPMVFRKKADMAAGDGRVIVRLVS